MIPKDYYVIILACHDPRVHREFVRDTATSCGRSIPTWQERTARVLSKRSLRRTRFSPTQGPGGATTLRIGSHIPLVRQRTAPRYH